MTTFTMEVVFTGYRWESYTGIEFIEVQAEDIPEAAQKAKEDFEARCAEEYSAEDIEVEGAYQCPLSDIYKFPKLEVPSDKITNSKEKVDGE
jgi:hypothetical protein